jgi:hypothetical protein
VINDSKGSVLRGRIRTSRGYLLADSAAAVAATTSSAATITPRVTAMRVDHDHSTTWCRILCATLLRTVSRSMPVTTKPILVAAMASTAVSGAIHSVRRSLR